MTPLPIRTFRGRDGTRLAYRELGRGRPVLLFHGYFSTAIANWVDHGHATKLADQGFRVIMPDLRGHGDSARPHDAAAYPADVLADDGLALIEQLGLERAGGYDFGGYSLGARVTVRMLVRGASPDRTVLAGIGLTGLTDTADRERRRFFHRILTGLGSFTAGSPEWQAERFLRSINGDPVALLHVLNTSVDTPIQAVRQISTPTLVVIGERDDERISASHLTAELPTATLSVVPGHHITAAGRGELSDAIVDFLHRPLPARP